MKKAAMIIKSGWGASCLFVVLLCLCSCVQQPLKIAEESINESPSYIEESAYESSSDSESDALTYSPAKPSEVQIDFFFRYG